MLQCQNYILADQIFTLLVGSPLSWLAVLKVSSILINFTLFYYYHISVTESKLTLLATWQANDLETRC